MVLVVLLVLGSAGSWLALRHHGGATHQAASAATTTTVIPTTTTSTTQPPGPGFVAGRVTAVGDSVMVDYQDPLTAAIPGIVVEAAVSRQWYEGEQILSQLAAEDQLGATVIVALGSNGPITASDFDTMMAILAGASKVVFVNTHVDRDWQDPNNAVLAAGVAQHKNAVLVDWNTLASQNPSWFGSDGTHLAIDGPGTQQLAALIAAAAS